MTVFSHSVADMGGKSNAGRKICAPLLLLTNDSAYAIITLYEGKEVAYARYFCDRTGLSGGKAAAPVRGQRAGPDLF